MARQVFLLGQIAYLLDLMVIHAHGLFGGEGDAALGRLQGDFAVHAVRGGNVHHIHQAAVHQRVIVGEAAFSRQVQALGRSLQRLRFYVANGGNFALFRNCQITGDMRAIHDAAYADQSHTDFCHNDYLLKFMFSYRNYTALRG